MSPKRLIAIGAGVAVAAVVWQVVAAGAAQRESRPPGVPAYAAPMNIRAPELDHEGLTVERSQASGTIAVEQPSGEDRSTR